jgi:hypothetical protein
MSELHPGQATQLRLSFAAAPPTRLRLDLAGLTVLVESDRPDAELFSFLATAGVEPEFRPGVGVSIPVRHLADLARLDVSASVSDTIRPLWLLVSQPPPGDLPATLEAENSHYVMSWEAADTVPYDEVVAAEAATALAYLDVPLVATDEVWERLEVSVPALGPSGRARLDADGYIVISTAKPQILESSTLPGLFRLSNTEFGVAAAYADAVVRESGIRWAGEPPHLHTPSLAVPNHLALAPHIAADLPGLVADLERFNAKAVVWDSGLGRRILVLAALEMLDAFPATVLCAPQSIWLWRRHVDLVGRTCGLLSEHADVQLVTYHDLAHRRIEPQAIIFDDIDSDEAVASWGSLRRLDHLGDAIRVALSDEWPEDAGEMIRLLSALRPNEFRADLQVAERYPIDPLRRLAEHAEVYLARRSRSDTPDLRAFRRSSVRVVEFSDAQRRAVSHAASRIGERDPNLVLSEVLEIVSAGPDNALGPKLSVAAQFVRSAAAASRSVVVATRHRRSAQLIKSMLRPLTCSALENPSPTAIIPKVPVAVLRYDHLMPDLTQFDLVVVLDYPWSLDVLDRAVGAGSDPNGPDVVVVHAAGSVDDRIAVFSARRAEISTVVDAGAPPDLSDVAYLLAPRR